MTDESSIDRGDTITCCGWHVTTTDHIHYQCVKCGSRIVITDQKTRAFDVEKTSPLLSDTDCQALQDIRADLLAIGQAVGDWGMPSVKISPNGWTMDITVEFGQKVGTLTAQAFLMVLKNSPGRLLGAMGMLLGEGMEELG